MADADQYWAHVVRGKENGLFGGDQEVGCVKEPSTCKHEHRRKDGGCGCRPFRGSGAWEDCY